VEGEAPPFWQSEVENAVANHGGDLAALWRKVRAADDHERAADLLLPTVSQVTDNVLARLYPQAAIGPAAGQAEAASGTGTGR
jgi:hypothetical protein